MEAGAEVKDQECMLLALEEARKCTSEPGKNSPLVGVVLARDGKIIGWGHRGELGGGEHAEYTLLEKKFPGEDLAGATIYTTLEPCTTRNHPKVPCARRILDRGITNVFIGMLDPDPRIYTSGSRILSEAGAHVRYFPKDIREQIERLNFAFSEKFASCALADAEEVEFDYKRHRGTFSIGQGHYLFETRWSTCGPHSVYLYDYPANIEEIALAVHANSFTDVSDAGIYISSYGTEEVKEGQIAVLKNTHGYYALVKVLRVTNVPADHQFRLKISYRILTDKTTDFSVKGTAPAT